MKREKLEEQRNKLDSSLDGSIHKRPFLSSARNFILLPSQCQLKWFDVIVIASFRVRIRIFALPWPRWWRSKRQSSLEEGAIFAAPNKHTNYWRSRRRRRIVFPSRRKYTFAAKKERRLNSNGLFRHFSLPSLSSLSQFSRRNFSFASCVEKLSRAGDRCQRPLLRAAPLLMIMTTANWVNLFFHAISRERETERKTSSRKRSSLAPSPASSIFH